MEEDSKSKKLVAWGLGLLGLGAVGTAVAVPKVGLWIGLAIVVLAILIFGGYLLFRHLKARRQSRNFEGAVAAQTSVSSRSISDPNRRAALDKLRQKFQTGLQEFKSRGKDIYKLPWYVIIGESGSGKTEAIRHSGIDFPPGLQNELQGAGGTINMDWWFTNRSVIIDTAGSMIFNEVQASQNPEWREFLRLLKKSRPHCPVNGLFLVLSIESLIKDSSETISRKASLLAQQLDLIQKTLDVRFPVYLLVTKCDLLAGFKEFFDNIDDPLLQHQIFGWSNPEDLDSPFRPELVEDHLKTVAERLRRRRLALLRNGAIGAKVSDTQFFVSTLQPGVMSKRRLDEVDLLFALPESVMRLAPRLRRYLETIFVAGEWSSKPVFLRGIYFTSSMREGQALDEATALALGVSVDQLPEDRQWDKNRAFFMRDLFMEKVFRENGLVTRATNTLKLVRQRRWLIFGTISVSLVLLLTFSFLAYRSLSRSVLSEVAFWQAGATNWVTTDQFPYPVWQPSLLRPGKDDPYHFTYAGADESAGVAGMSLGEYQEKLGVIAQKPLKVGLVFKPMTWLGSGRVSDRRQAQELLFEGGVVRPLVYYTRLKMTNAKPAALTGPAVGYHRDALLSLIQLEADGLAGGGTLSQPPDKYLKAFVSYLSDTNWTVDTNLTAAFQLTYGKSPGGAAWPPATILGGKSLAENTAISDGLQAFRAANEDAQQGIAKEVGLVNDYADGLYAYQQAETGWLGGQGSGCDSLATGGNLFQAWTRVDKGAASLQSATNYTANPLTNLTAHYQILKEAAVGASTLAFHDILTGLPDTARTAGLFVEINQKIQEFAQKAGDVVLSGLSTRTNFVAAVDRDELASAGAAGPAYASRWNLYKGACDLAGAATFGGEEELGKLGDRITQFKQHADSFRSDLTKYNGPLADQTRKVCLQIAGDAESQGQEHLLQAYVLTATNVVGRLTRYSQWTPKTMDDSAGWLARITHDLNSPAVSRPELLQPVGRSLVDAAGRVYRNIGFPVMLAGDASNPMTVADMVALHNLSAAMVQTLADPGWVAVLDPASAERAKTLVKNYRLAGKVLDSLLDAQGNPPHVHFSFVPPKETETDNVNIISDFRQAQAVMGSLQSVWKELAIHIGQSPVTMFPDDNPSLSDGLQISFRRLSTDHSPVKFLDVADWSLVRLIRDGAAKSDDGRTWEVSVGLKDEAQSIAGKAVFEIVTPVPLPTTDWPQN